MGSLRDILEKIALEFPKAKLEPIKQHPLVKFAERDSVREIEKLLSIEPNDDIFVKASLGEGAWANIPWIAILSRSVTNGTTSGYYPVYLYSADCQLVYLCMGQGVTKIKEEFSKNWKSTLHSRAEIIRSRIPEHATHFNSEKIILGGSTILAKQYEEAPAFCKKYNSTSLPSNEILMHDLTAMLELYNKLIFLGGTDYIEDDRSEIERGRNLSLSEKKQYRIHRIIEGRANTAKVKKHHGYCCQVCDFNFQKVYGDLGIEYIEAHHLVPYSRLEHGKSRNLNIDRDFAVLCANCHRMIHRMESPADIEGLKKILNKPTH